MTARWPSKSSKSCSFQVRHVHKAWNVHQLTLRCTRGLSLVRVDRGLDPPPPLRALRALRSGSGPRPMRNLGDVCGGGALRALRLVLFARGAAGKRVRESRRAKLSSSACVGVFFRLLLILQGDSVLRRCCSLRFFFMLWCRFCGPFGK